MDREFRKTFSRRPKKERNRIERQLVGLVEALQASDHPILEPALSRYRPSRYAIGSIRGDTRLVEYRLGGTLRVVACFFDDLPDHLLLLTVTLHHDHERMKRLIQSHRGSFRDEIEASADNGA
ncbi:MAG: hypothetical protein D6696_17140 [Acidobacteria bacterium]|nr:MAG: hypothetical protein D6696_17140 [Acidobacteriota bacterium]